MATNADPTALSVTERIEAVSKRVTAAVLPALVNILGFRCELYKPLQDVTSDVYGTYAGAKTTGVGTLIKLLMSDTQWRSLSDISDSWIDDMDFVYTTYLEVENDDIVVITRPDEDLVLRFKVIEKEHIGLHTKIVSRFKLSAVI